MSDKVNVSGHEMLSKAKIIEEYGNCFIGDYYKVEEYFGKTPSTIEPNKFNLDRLIAESRYKDIAFYQAKKESLEVYVKENMPSFFWRLYNRTLLKSIKSMIADYDEKITNSQECKTTIRLLDDTEYSIPKDRLHDGDKVYIVDFFQKPFEPVFDIFEVQDTDLSVVNDEVVLHYFLTPEKEGRRWMIKNNSQTGALESDFADRFIFSSIEDAKAFVVSHIESKCGLLKVAESELMSSIKDFEKNENKACT